jgi:triosephosphate isomerase (TIM)
MRKQIAAANWKMNLTLAEGEALLKEITSAELHVNANKLAVFGIPFPYLPMAKGFEKPFVLMAAQNCSDKKSGAYTGEVSVGMLQSMGVQAIIIGHSERREYFAETNAMLATKVDLALAASITPIFCCGEALAIREAGSQNDYVAKQIEESLFHLTADQLKQVVIAYEPIWAIGTGKTATSDQAQEMHAHIRKVLANKYGVDVANEISILYGGSVKAANAKEIFGQPDVDGGLVGGASLVAAEFITIINSLK